MARKTRRSVLELDAGTGSRPGLAVAATTPLADFEAKEENREGLAELDRMTEASERLTRAQKDRERIVPRNASAALNPATKTRIPEFDEIRAPISGRQMKERSKLKRAVQNRWTLAQHQAVKEVLTSDATWTDLTDPLSATQGDTDDMSPKEKATVQRVDRAIRQFEEKNDRLHVVYANVQLPPVFDASKLTSYPAVHLDRWTAGAHNLGDVSDDPSIHDGSYVLEIPTRRGMYMGHSDGGTNTAHLLPRGMSFTVDEVYTTRWRNHEGKTGTRRVIRLREINTEG